MLLLAAYIVLCLLAAFWGQNRYIGFWGFLIASIVFSPCLTLLYLVLSWKEGTKVTLVSVQEPA